MSDPHDIADAKARARAFAREARCALDPATCSAAAAALAQNLLTLPELVGVSVVLAYGATPEEIDPGPAVRVLRDRGAAIAYPRIEAPGVLGLHLIEDEADLERGPYGLTQPAANALRLAREAVDAVIVPGVAFDLAGARLGYGGGYYDRLLPTLRPGCARVGVAYDEQVLERIPAQDHDVLVDVLVTPTRVIRRDAI